MAEGTSIRTGDVDLIRLANIVLRFRAGIIGACLVVAFVVGLTVVLSPRDYSSLASFTPQSRQLPSALSGIASQFGLSMPGSETNQSPAFYADLLRSRAVLDGVVGSTYVVKMNGNDSVGNLVQFFNSRGRTPARRHEAAVNTLSEATDISTSLKTGVVQLRVTTRSPELSKQVAERFLGLLNAFNLRNRQGQASAERLFTEQRAAEVRLDLKAAEEREQEFLQRNRDFHNSPELTFAHDRLAREVALQQQVYTTLAQALEQVRIEEVRDTPVITVIERPQVAARPNSRGTIRKTILGALLGAMLGLGLALWREFILSADPSGSSALAEFLRLRSDVLLDLRHPLQALRRAVRPGTPTG